MPGPIVSLTRKDHFSAAHRLHSPHLTDEENVQIYGKCNNPHGHGHNYHLEVTLKGPVDRKTGMVINLTEIKSILKDVLEIVDHRNLDKEVEFFFKTPSTTENLTIFLWEEIKKRLENPSFLHEVVVHETANNIFKYHGEYDQA